VFGCGFGFCGIDVHSADRIFSESGLYAHQAKKTSTAEIAEKETEFAEEAEASALAACIHRFI
jgi:hypothetical protein